MDERKFEPGTPVWVVERDEDSNPYDVSGYVFLAQVGDFVIASPYINDHDELDYLMEYHRRETCEDYDADLPVFYADDCFATHEAAREALEGWLAE